MNQQNVFLRKYLCSTFQDEGVTEIAEVGAEILKQYNMQHSGHMVKWDADHQNSCLFTNKGHFSSPLWLLLGVLAKFHQ